ncbi:F-box associated interaction domain-containing protein [Artemisia annua]|uniref:F-box associated interaction domain-containing protein n=1 Tax=Artemisia annua TaxID=35608 RepID=A0A2U1M8H0_ARTAN|nr:F-box associated interaction domain-containing protein [Artemisia annua]
MNNRTGPNVSVPSSVRCFGPDQFSAHSGFGRLVRVLSDTYLENLKGEHSSVEAENAKLSDNVENRMKGNLDDSIRLQSNLEGLSSSLVFIQSLEIEDALTGLEVIEYEGNQIRLSLRTYIPETELPEQNHELAIDLLDGTLELRLSIEYEDRDEMIVAHMVDGVDAFIKIYSHLFPPEIIREILLKVATVKSLLRCKAVCKDWYSLISDQHFVKAHYTLSSTNINYKHHRLIYNIYKDDYHLISCPLYDVLFDGSVNNALLLENRGFRIVGSCNGLTCLLHSDNTLFIYNPSTRTTNVLSRWAGWSTELYGFGYDETTHDYKVVKIYPGNLRTPYWGTNIYSLKAGSWKAIGRFPFVNPFNDAMFLNGALHWVTDDARDIVSLDLGKETYGEVLQPEYDEGSKRLTLGVWGEWLCVLCNYCESRVVDVWVMKVYGEKDSWTKLLSISHPNDRFWDPFCRLIHAPLCISNDGKLLLQLGEKLVVFDSINGSYSDIQIFIGYRSTCIVVESLISPFAR